MGSKSNDYPKAIASSTVKLPKIIYFMFSYFNLLRRKTLQPPNLQNIQRLKRSKNYLQILTYTIILKLLYSLRNLKSQSNEKIRCEVLESCLLMQNNNSYN